MPAPSITTALAISNDNTQATITFDQQVFANDGSTALTYLDFGVTATSTAILNTANCSVSTNDNTTFTFTLDYTTAADTGDTLQLTGTVYNGAVESLDLSGDNSASVALNDLTPPTISSISVASDNSTTTLAKANDKITFTVAFSEAVTLSAASDVKVPFTIGGTSKEAIAQSTNTSTINTTANAINFEYTVEAGLNGSVALVAGPLTQSNSATVLDAAGNALIGNMATLSGSVTVDTTTPFISSISVASDNSTTTLAKANDKITFTVAFSEAVTLSAASDVKVPFTIGTTSKEAIAQSTNTATINTTANAINFEYTVEVGLIGNVALVAGPLTQSNSATVLDAAGNALTGNMTTLSGSTVTVDSTAPTTTNATVLTVTGGTTVGSTTYANAGDTLSFQVEFSEAVSWTNASNVSFDFSIGTATATATTTATNSDVNNKVLFTYDVLAGQTGAVAIPANTNLNVANGDSIVDAAGNTMSTLTLQTLSGNASIDTTAPTMTISVTDPNSNAVLSNSSGIFGSYTVTFTSSESTITFSASDISVNYGIISNFTGSGTTYTATWTLNSYKKFTISVDAGAYTDTVGNANVASTPFTIIVKPHVNANACFLKNTPINTDQGSIAIEKIIPFKNTIRGHEIRAITETVLTKPNMIKFEANCLYNNIPNQDVYVSPDHKVYYNGKMRNASEFVKMDLASNYKVGENTIVHNVLLDTHEKMITCNMIVETQNPDSILAYYYNNFIVNKNISANKQAYVIGLMNEIFEKKWVNTNINIQGLTYKQIMKEMFIAYKLNQDKTNKKQLRKTVNKLIQI
jgi:hypothetical protein